MCGLIKPPARPNRVEYIAPVEFELLGQTKRSLKTRIKEHPLINTKVQLVEHFLLYTLFMNYLFRCLRLRDVTGLKNFVIYGYTRS